MTSNEIVINTLDAMKKQFLGETRDILDKAIEALKENEQYKAIGTPTQIYEKIGGLNVELGKYHSIGTIEEFKALKEKEEPKKPLNDGMKRPFSYYCPNCKEELSDDGYEPDEEYCCTCGQHIMIKEEGADE